MPTLIIPKTYATNQILTEQDLDNIRSSLLTFFNVTKLDQNNLQLTQIASALTEAQANAIFSQVSSSAINQSLDKISATTAQDIFEKTSFTDDSTTTSEGSAGTLSSTFAEAQTTTGNEGTFLILIYGRFTGSSSNPAQTVEMRLQKNSVTVPLFTSNDLISTVGITGSMSTAVIQTLESADVLSIQLRRLVGSSSVTGLGRFQLIRLK